jgi:malate dehydrogenase (oxaloacetate-decarboxylating)
MRALWRDEDGAWRTTLRGRQVLADPRINKGTAFGDSERRDLGLTGLIPAAHFTPDDQVARVYPQYARYAAITRGELALARYLLELSDAA